MFWYLLLAHFIADYPLQPNWMVHNKRRLWVLCLHVAIHLVVMLAVVGSLRWFIWPHLVVLMLAHFWIDVGKNTVYKLRPTWVVGPYLIDQLFHYISIWLVSLWIERSNLPSPLPIAETWVILVIGYLLATYVWFISENIFAHAEPEYRHELKNQLWSRMFSRAALLSGLLFLGNSFTSLAMAVQSADRFPYLSGEYRWRALFTDIGVVITVLIFIQITT